MTFDFSIFFYWSKKGENCILKLVFAQWAKPASAKMQSLARALKKPAWQAVSSSTLKNATHKELLWNTAYGMCISLIVKKSLGTREGLLQTVLPGLQKI